MLKKSIIEEIYRRMIQENKPSVEYLKLQKENIKLSDKFEENLTEEQEKQFEDLIEHRLIMEDTRVKDLFIQGFKLAIKIIAEVFYKEDT